MRVSRCLVKARSKEHVLPPYIGGATVTANNCKADYKMRTYDVACLGCYSRILSVVEVEELN